MTAAGTVLGNGQTLGFPRTSVSTTSRDPSALADDTTWIPGSTSFGQVFGSSQDRSHLVLHPAADDPTAPSVTTFTFAEPTPVGRWGLALGDIDDEALEVAAPTPTATP